MGHDVVCLGEALVDFLPERRGARVRDVARWHPCIGGAPANVAVGVRRLGGSSALVGVTGDDEFGHFLKQGLEAEGVDVRWLRQTTEGKTGLGFVSLTMAGERSFTFYRTQAAETFLCGVDTRRARPALHKTKVLHVGTNSLLQLEARAAVEGALTAAFTRGALTSCDPNLRLHLWKRPRELKALLGRLLPLCAVIKVSEEEIGFVTGTDDVEAALRRLSKLGASVAIVTRGAAGASVGFLGHTLSVKAPQAKVIDTTGAGDGFTAGFLFALTRLAATRAQLLALTPAQVEAMARVGCVVGSRVVTKLGAVAGLPRFAAVRSALR